MRPTDLERAEREAQFRYAQRAAIAVELIRARQRVDALEAEYADAEALYQTSEAKAAALRPVAGVTVRARLGVVP